MVPFNVTNLLVVMEARTRSDAAMKKCKFTGGAEEDIGNGDANCIGNCTAAGAHFFTEQSRTASKRKRAGKTQ
jgi:hypothetical protein